MKTTITPATVWKIHNFCIEKMQTSKYPFVQALGGMVIQFQMGFVYVQYLEEGKRQCQLKAKSAKRAKQK